MWVGRDQPPGRGLELAHPELLPADREQLDRVVLRRRLGSAGAPRLERLGRHRGGVLELAREQRAHRPPDDRVPQIDRLAQPLRAGGERLDLGIDRVPIALLEQVDDEPRVRLQLELQVGGLAGELEHLGRGLSRCLRWLASHSARRRRGAGGGERLRVAQLLGERRRLLGRPPHPVAALGE